jgi:hypothetical protein
MTLSQKKRNFTGIIAITLLLIFCMLISPALIVFDAQNINFLRAASASGIQNNPQEQLKPFDHIILTWAGNPATTQAVTWRSRVRATIMYTPGDGARERQTGPSTLHPSAGPKCITSPAPIGWIAPAVMCSCFRSSPYPQKFSTTNPLP